MPQDSITTFQAPTVSWRAGRWTWCTVGRDRSMLSAFLIMPPPPVLQGSTLCPAGSLSITAPTPPSTLRIISTTHLECDPIASAPCQPTTGSARPGPWRTSATPSAMGADPLTSFVNGRSPPATGVRMALFGSPAPPGSQSIMMSWMLPPAPCDACPCNPAPTLCPAHPARARTVVPESTPPCAHLVPVLIGCRLAARTSMQTLLPMS